MWKAFVSAILPPSSARCLMSAAKTITQSRPLDTQYLGSCQALRRQEYDSLLIANCLVEQMRLLFKTVHIHKPRSSRPNSAGRNLSPSFVSCFSAWCHLALIEACKSQSADYMLGLPYVHEWMLPVQRHSLYAKDSHCQRAYRPQAWRVIGIYQGTNKLSGQRLRELFCHFCSMVISVDFTHRNLGEPNQCTSCP